MTARSRHLLLAALVLLWGAAASAQTADDIIEKHLTAMGGREALGKLTSRSAVGVMTMSTPGGDVSGPFESMAARPNKSRTLINLDLSALGAGAVVMDQRFDGAAGYALDSMRGNHDITGGQLDNMKNGFFPSPLLNYKERGTAVELKGKEKAGDRDAYVLVMTPKSGPAVRTLIDAETYLPLKSITTIDVPGIGPVEQTTEILDLRDVDGVKVPFKIKGTSSVQSFTVTLTKVEHNKKIDETLFSKPSK